MQRISSSVPETKFDHARSLLNALLLRKLPLENDTKNTSLVKTHLS